MVRKGHSASAAAAVKRPRPGALERVTYKPPLEYPLDIEIITTDELRQRVMQHRFRQAHQINFYLLMLVESGRCQPVVDYTPLKCKAGSLVLVRPNQALKFDLSSPWDGRIAIFPAEYLATSGNEPGGDFLLAEDMQGLPAMTSLTPASRQLIASILALMQDDTRDQHQPPMTNAMLRFQLKSLLLRLQMLSDKTKGPELNSAQAVRFKQFRALVEEKYASQHKIADYASQLHCTVKSLSRAAMEATGIGAKAYLAGRINLEAKRLLTHTRMPVSAISEQLGFDEPTNFVKFFKRGCGLAPSEFRKQHYSIYN